MKLCCCPARFMSPVPEQREQGRRGYMRQTRHSPAPLTTPGRGVEEVEEEEEEEKDI